MYPRLMLQRILLCMFCFIPCLYADQLIKGTAQQEQVTFPFPVCQTIDTFEKTDYFVTADFSRTGSGIVKDYSIAHMRHDGQQFSPLAPEKISINGVEYNNPFYDHAISHCTLLQKTISAITGLPLRPVIVSSHDPQTIFLLNIVNQKPELITAENRITYYKNIPDATGLLTSGIVGLQAGSPSVFALVKPNKKESVFGDPGSGIVHIILGLIELEEKNKNKKDDKKPVDEKDKNYHAAFLILDREGTNRGVYNRALALDRTTSEVKLDADLAYMGNPIMHWSPEVQRLYVGLDVKAENQPNAGARALVIGRTDKNHAFTLEPIAPDNAFEAGANTIIGGRAAQGNWSINHIKTLFTSTSISYLIVSSGAREMYALPLVTGNENLPLNGRIAKKDAIPQDFCFTLNNIDLFMGARFIKEPAEKVEDMPVADDPATRVGTGPLPYGDISSVKVDTDTVFVCVSKLHENDIPGVYASQALFDMHGKIKGWTEWQRVCGVNHSVDHFFWDAQYGNVTSIANTPDSSIVRRTSWLCDDASHSKSFVEIIQDEFPQSSGGVQGLYSFNHHTPGLNGGSAIVVTGLHKVLFVYFDQEATAKGSTENFTHTVFTGDIIEQLGPITTACIANTGQRHCLIVGGIGGVALLHHKDGKGLDGLHTQALHEMTCKKIGTYRHVKALMADKQYVYILTSKQLDRIDMQAGMACTTIAHVEHIKQLSSRASFFDFIVSGPLAILATSKGLYRIGNQCDARTIRSSQEGQWTMVPLPEFDGAVTQLIPATVTGQKNDIARYVGGHMYVLSTYKEHNVAQIHRYSIAPVDEQGVNDLTVFHMPDFFVDKQHSYFVNAGYEISRFATDGSLYLLGQNKIHTISPALLKALPCYLSGELDQIDSFTKHSGRRFLGIQSRTILSFDTGSFISAITRNPVTGSWMIAGDWGVRVNE